MQKGGGKSVRGVRLIVPDLPKIRQQFYALRDATVGGYRVIYADPPWPFENRSPRGMKKNASMHYPCISLADLRAMPVDLLAADNAVLFLWTVWPLMPHWDGVIRAWGFEFAGLAWEWVKYNPTTAKYAFGPGYGTRKNLEPCLMATRGNPRLRQNCPLFGETAARSRAQSVRDFIEWWPLEEVRAPRREHSRKPEEARFRIESMFDGPMIELFARTRREGWAAWGNETERFAGLDV